MPARVVDGALWRSEKLKCLAVGLRGEYANLLPLAEANGVFDCNSDRVWSDVYSFNRPDFSVEKVKILLDQLEIAGLLYRWSQNGKTWGYWVGIHKSGRLPSETHLKRYKNLPPNPPTEALSAGSIPDNPGSVPELPVRYGIGLVLDRCGIGLEEQPQNLEPEIPENGQEEQMKIKQEITAVCYEFDLGSPESYANIWQEMVAMERGTSRGAAVNEFREWAQANQGDDFRGKPVSAFLRQRQHGGIQRKQAAADPVEVNLVRELAYWSDGEVTFDDKAKAGMAAEVARGNTVEEIIAVFKRDFLPKVLEDEFKLKRAGQLFVQEVDQLVSRARRKAQEHAQEAQAVAEAKERLETQAAAERVARRASLEREADAVEETLGGGE